MRQGLFLALQGALAAAVALEPISYLEHPGMTKRGCDNLRGCGKYGHDGYAPDASTLHYPHRNKEYGNSWDLCKGDHRCDNPYGKVDYTFLEEDLVFEFFKSDSRGNFVFEEVEVKIQAKEEPNDRSPRYSLDNGHCKYEDGLKCHVPWKDLSRDGSYGDLCPVDDKGSFILYIEIRIVITIGKERYEIYSKSIEEQSYWFSIGYTCGRCDECRDHSYGNYDNDNYGNYGGYDHGNYKRGNDLYSGYNPDYVCTGADVQVWGTGHSNYHPLSEFAYGSHPNSCRDHQGYYNKYSYSELEVAVAGEISVDYDAFAAFAIELEKKGRQTDIIVAVDIHNAKYFVTEIAVFVQCDGGIDDLNSGTNICAPQSYPHRRYDPKGLSNVEIAITDEFQCRGDYYIAIYVKVCISEGNYRYYRI